MNGKQLTYNAFTETPSLKDRLTAVFSQALAVLPDRAKAYFRFLLNSELQNRTRRHLSQMPETSVVGGPFSGMKLPGYIPFSIPVVLGTYEIAVQKFLLENGPWERFTEIGSAQGYYLVGMKLSRLANCVVGYESLSTMRDVSLKLAQANSVSIDELHGTFDLSSLKNLAIQEGRRHLVMIDIEGAEYDLLTPNAVQHLAESQVELLIELHPFLLESSEKHEQLLTSLSMHYRWNEHSSKCAESIHMPFDFARELSETDLRVLFSENRQREQKWIFCSPLQKN